MIQGGRPKCWGSNANGNLDMARLFLERTNVPGDVEGVPIGVVSIASGPWRGCVVTVLADTYCWGHIDYTNGSYITRQAFGPPVAPAVLTLDVGWMG